MYSDLFTAESLAELKTAFLTQFPMALWETFYVTVLSTALAILLGLPLGVLLVAWEKDGVLPLPKPVLSALNVIINLLRSIPFLILMIMVFPLSRLIIGTAVGTTATIVPLVVAAFPFVARLVESSLREVDPNIIEAAQSMGATPMQIICKVMIPESVPSLIQNVTISLTTILGLIVMAFGNNVGTALMQPVALVCIGGLLYATLMTLLVVPCMYDILSRRDLRKVDEEELKLLDM